MDALTSQSNVAGYKAVLVAATALTIAPWTIRNAVVLQRFIPVSDENGITLAGTYNPTSAANRQVPYKWMYYAAVPAYAPIVRASSYLTEPDLSSRLSSAAFHYIADHPLAPLHVAYHNLRRLLELEGSAAWRDSAASIGISAGTARIGNVLISSGPGEMYPQIDLRICRNEQMTPYQVGELRPWHLSRPSLVCAAREAGVVQREALIVSGERVAVIDVNFPTRKHEDVCRRIRLR